jgi:ParB/RepB/Spo0J family partition protein
MKPTLKQLSVPLSHLVPSRRNPRKVKPSREAHHRLVALIRSQGLLQPLVVRNLEGKPKHYEVVAGERRLRALREIHRGDGDPKILCVLGDVDSITADAMSLGENFGREAMHPLDEAEAFAKLATSDGKDAIAIAAEFGVAERYVKQRMKLATLAEPVKSAHREGEIDTSTAEAFAAVPKDRQLEVWKELNGHPQHAGHVRNIIANAWIDSTHALFDLSTLPESAVSGDLFGDRILVERLAFMEAQAQSLAAERQALTEDGWAEVVVGRREDVQDRLYSMNEADREFDKETSRRLARIVARREKLEKTAEKLGDGDETRLDRLSQRFDALAAEEQEIVKQAPVHFSEETKAIATSFLILDPDGRAHREYRVPRRRHTQSAGGNGHGASGVAGEKPAVPTSDELGDKQLAVTFTHQALGVREALLKNSDARKSVLALILHEKVRSEALAVRHDANGTTLQAGSEGFSSAAFDRLREKRTKFDPFRDQNFVEDVQGYEELGKLSASKIDALAAVAAAIRGWDENELLDHLLNNARTNPTLVEVVRTEMLRENTHNLNKLVENLEGYLGEAEEIISVQRVLPAGQMTKAIHAGHVKVQAEQQNFGHELVEAKLRFGRQLRRNFLLNYNPAKTRQTMAVVSSGLEEVRTCSGNFASNDPMDAFEFFDELREESILNRQVDFRLIDDSTGRLDAHRLDWIAPYDGVMTIDGWFMMKMGRGHQVRTFLIRGRSNEENEELDLSLKQLRELLQHATTFNRDIKAKAKLLDHYCVNVEREAEQVRAQNKMIATDVKSDPLKQAQDRKAKGEPVTGGQPSLSKGRARAAKFIEELRTRTD